MPVSRHFGAGERRRAFESLVARLTVCIACFSLKDLKSSSSAWASLSEADHGTRITSLDISNNPKLREFPAVVTRMAALKVLNASSCELSVIPDLSALHSLTNLKLEHNSLTFSTVMGLPSSITKLDISRNRLVSLPSAFSALANVSVLILSDNQLEDLTGISALVQLVELVLAGNVLARLPEELAQCSKLHTLDLSNNRIRFLEPSAGGPVIPAAVFVRTELHRLQLKGNPITQRQVMQLEGIEALLERRRVNKDKLLQGGGLSDGSLFGLEDR